MESATVLQSDSLDGARVPAGEDYDEACVPPAARAMLTRFDDRSAQNEVRLTPTGESGP